MVLDPEVLLNWQFPSVTHKYTNDDTIRYALSIGMGSDPLDERELRYVTLDGLQTMPSLATILSPIGPWTADPRTSVTRGMLLHGEQTVTLHSSLPPMGTVVGTARVIAVTDYGKERGAVIHVERSLRNATSGAIVATLTSASVCRADGGFGGRMQPRKPPDVIPSRCPDACVDMPTSRRAALLYQLNGDHNPLHTNPAYARKAGFDAPILHGLCTFGIATHAVLRVMGNYRPDALRTIGGRFSAPVYPGEVLAVEMWRDGAEVSFRVWSKARHVKVLDQGHACLRDN